MEFKMFEWRWKVSSYKMCVCFYVCVWFSIQKVVSSFHLSTYMLKNFQIFSQTSGVLISNVQTCLGIFLLVCVTSCVYMDVLLFVLLVSYVLVYFKIFYIYLFDYSLILFIGYYFHFFTKWKYFIFCLLLSVFVDSHVYASFCVFYSPSCVNVFVCVSKYLSLCFNVCLWFHLCVFLFISMCMQVCGCVCVIKGSNLRHWMRKSTDRHTNKITKAQLISSYLFTLQIFQTNFSEVL